MNVPDREKTKLLVRALYDAQMLRIQCELRTKRLVREEIMTEEEAKETFKLPFSHLTALEKEMEKLVWKQTRNLPVIKRWLKKIRGIGPRLGGLLVANIGDVGRFDTVSKLWAYAGLHVVDGRAAKRAKGQKANWNRELKTTAWKIGKSFVISGGPYRDLYERYKARIIEREQTRGNVIYESVEGKWKAIGQNRDEAQRMTASQERNEAQSAIASQTPDWTLGRINNMAMRYVVKRFLAHLWAVWREIEKLPARPVYPVEYLGHNHQDDPWDYIEQKAK